jgi:hypothetical protein
MTHLDLPTNEIILLHPPSVHILQWLLHWSRTLGFCWIADSSQENYLEYDFNTCGPKHVIGCIFMFLSKTSTYTPSSHQPFSLSHLYAFSPQLHLPITKTPIIYMQTAGSPYVDYRKSLPDVYWVRRLIAVPDGLGYWNSISQIQILSAAGHRSATS